MGQRVGLSFAKGLLLATNAAAVALTTLEALAETAGYPVAVAIDARRGQVYTQSFSPDGTPRGPAELLGYEEAARRMAGEGRCTGSGVSAADPARNPLGPPTPTAEALLRLAEQRHPSPLRTLYLRPPDARPAGKASL